MDADQRSDGRSVSMKDVYNRVSIDDDQWFHCHVLPQTKLSPIRLLYLVSLCFYFRKVPRNITGD